jgi:NodT family efflux transporter outer membrane factor (OMF) lipoprotein
MKLTDLRVAALAAQLALLTACAAGPNYVRPSVQTPDAFKESKDWKTAQPRDDAKRGNWWEVYNDPLLNDLERQVDISNQNLAQAQALFRQAQASVQAARAGYFPTLSGSVSSSRARGSANLTGRPGVAPAISTLHTLSLDAAWEADVWGKVSRTVEASQAGAQASAADLESARLSAHAALAQDYFQLRVLDAEKKLLDDTVAAYEKSLQLTRNRYASGVAAKAEVVQAETQLKTTQAQAIDLGVQRAQLEHAVALLIGKPASHFSIAAAPLGAVAPTLPLGVPSQLLERRPDIAASERRVAAANAQIGVARAAFFPALTLSASGGFESSSFAKWLTFPSRSWSLGPALAQSLFDAGLRRAQTDQAIAAYDANVAAYRQTVLTGFQEVEDNLAALRILEQEAQVQDEAVKSARQSVALALNQYKAGTISYLDVVTVQATALSNERAAVQILGRRLAADVLLVKALGGGWKASELPSGDTLAKDLPR